MIDTKLLRQKILDLTIRGKLVPQDPADEPASELLKKIKAEKEALVKAGKIKKDKHESHIFKGDDNRYYETIDGKTADITEEIPFDLPEGWAWGKLATITSVVGDGVHGTPNYDCSGDVFFINGNNLSNGHIVIKNDTKRLTQQEAQKYQVQLNERTVLVSINGTIGNIAFYDNEPIILGKSACYFNLCVGINKHYIKQVILADYFLCYAFKVATGSTIKNVPLAGMRNFLIPIPPLAEQQRIVEQIETLLKYVDIIDADAETLDKSITLAKQKILDLAIRGKLVPQDPADEPASELLKKIKAEKDALVKAGKLKKDKHESYIFKSDDNCYYEQLNGKTVDITVDIPFNLPPKWCWCRLKNIIDLLSGRDLTPQNYNDKGGRYPYITGASNFDKSKLIINRWTDAPEVISIPNDVLLTCKGTIGEITINSVGEIHIARQIMALRPSPSIIKEYLATVLQSMINHIKSEANGLIPGISRDVILELLIPLPPLTEQQRIVQAITQYNSVIELISK